MLATCFKIFNPYPWQHRPAAVYGVHGCQTWVCILYCTMFFHIQRETLLDLLSV